MLRFLENFFSTFLRFLKILKMLPPCGPVISAVRWSWMTNRASRAIYSSRRPALEVHHQPVKTQTLRNPRGHLVFFGKSSKARFGYLMAYSASSRPCRRQIRANNERLLSKYHPIHCSSSWACRAVRTRGVAVATFSKKSKN